MVKNIYIGKSLAELNADKATTENQLKNLGSKFTNMDFGPLRDDLGVQIYGLYFELSQIDKAIKATINAT